MHFIVHWEFPRPDPINVVIESELAGVLLPYSWARPLTNFFVVNVVSSEQYTALSGALQFVANKYPANILLIISPPMSGGRYSGMLPPNLWTELNIRSI